VVERQHPVELALAGPGEERVRALGSVGVDPAPARRGDGGAQDGVVLASQQPPLAGVGIEPGDGDAAVDVAGQAVQGLAHPRVADGGDRRGERLVGAQERDSQVRAQEGHQIVPAVALEAAGRRQVVRVPAEPGIHVPGDRLLRERRGDEPVDDPPPRQVGAEVERRQCPGRVRGPRPPERERPVFADRIDDGQPAGRQARELLARRRRGEEREPLPVALGDPQGGGVGPQGGALGHQQGAPRGARGPLEGGAQCDLGADAGGIALGQGEDGGGRHAHRRAVTSPACRRAAAPLP